MEGLFPDAPTPEMMFTGFGRSTFIQQKVVSDGLDVDGEPGEIRRHLRTRCPSLPGVYGMIDAHGALIYVGMSSRLRQRLLTYFTQGRPEAKEQRVAAHAHRVMWEVGDHEFTVRLRELELIRRWCPRFNSLGRPGRREVGYLYLARGPAPNFRFGRWPQKGCGHSWGPLPLTRRTRAAVKQLNHLFLLRDCSDRMPVRFAEQRFILPDDCQPACLRGDVGTCRAPCAGDRSRDDYFRGIEEARSFLDGRDRNILDRYETAMQEAALAQRYELAAAQRDLWQSLSALWGQLELLRIARHDHTGVYALRGWSGKTWWAMILAGKVVQIIQRPKSKGAARRFRDLIDSTYRLPAPAAPEDYDQIRIVVSWYRQHAEEKAAVMTPNQARDFCSDVDHQQSRHRSPSRHFI